MLFNFLTQGCERLFIFYILTFCIQKFNSLKLAPEPPKGDKMEKDGGSGGSGGNGGSGVGDSPRTPEGGQAASGRASNW